MRMYEARAVSRFGSKSGRWLFVLAMIVVTALVLAACESDNGDDTEDVGVSDAVADTGSVGSDSSSGDPMLDFYQCLRDGGLDVEDPGADTFGFPDHIDPNHPATEAIISACSQEHFADTDGRVTVGGDGAQMGDNMASKESLLEFVDCMREAGVDMPDPGADGTLQLPEDFDPNSSEFQSAGQTCAQLLDGGIMMGQPGGEGRGMVGR